MSNRYAYAIKAVNTHDLLDLAKLMAGSVQEAIQEGQMPHMDPAIRLITHHIAFVGNGDFPIRKYYVDCYEYCAKKAQDGPNVVFTQESNNGPEAPPYPHN